MAKGPSNRRFVVLGLGTFGSALAVRLTELGYRVTGVDSSEKQIQALQDQLYEAVVADVTDREALSQLLVSEAEAVFISLGEQIERSILAALHVRELGAENVIAKAVSTEHAKVLEKLGVQRVIIPEVEFARELAEKVSEPNVLERLHIDPQYSIIELEVPNSLIGKTLQEADLRRRFGVTVIGARDVLHGTVQVVPGADYMLTDDKVLIIIGTEDSLRKVQELK
jgi:trk system potassium uptake protein TrkA